LEISENEVVNNIDPYHEIDDTTTCSESSLSSTSTRESKGSFNTVSEPDGFKYLCGFITRKFKENFPDMGIDTKDIISDHSYSHPPDWLQFLSFRGLTVPSHKWLKEARIIEKYFKKYHAEGFRKGSGITKKLVNIVLKKHNISEHVRAYTGVPKKKTSP
jgi:hypothetical protein